MELCVDKISQFQQFYAWALTQSDKRVEGWLLMDAYTPTLLLTGLYVAITVIGPKLMTSREALSMKNLLVLYNFILVAMNFHICKELFTASWTLNYSYSCQKVDYSDNPDEIRIAKALWWFYFSKLVEMFDTIFFILRKKDNQISFLHVYHHATMFPIWWIGVKWVAGGQSFFGAMINSFVHVIMYSYYGVSALGPQYQKYLWWKRYLTKVQLTQFFVGMVYGLQGVYFECDFVLWMQYASMAYGVTMIMLFFNFYYRAYMSPKVGREVQFVCAIVHTVISLFIACDFPQWMQWALAAYAFSILSLFINFYFHAYLKRRVLQGGKICEKDRAITAMRSTSKNGKNGYVKNGVSVPNGMYDKKKE